MLRLAAALAVLASTCTSGGAPITTEAQPGPVGTPVEIESVIDGDSVRVAADGQSLNVRLLGINAPEQDECWSEEATAALEQALAGRNNSIVGAEEDQYGRLLAYVYSGATNVNYGLVLDGSAIAIAVDHEDLPDFLAAEEEAISLERGLWAPTACGSSSDRFEVRIWAIEPDAPGRDDRNPNREWVAITNAGQLVDLSGWVLRDESSTHRYVFPDGFILATGEIVTVRSGCGEDARPDLYWCADGTVWTNSGDTVLLLDGFGAVVDRMRYLDD